VDASWQICNFENFTPFIHIFIFIPTVVADLITHVTLTLDTIPGGYVTLYRQCTRHVAILKLQFWFQEYNVHVRHGASKLYHVAILCFKVHYVTCPAMGKYIRISGDFLLSETCSRARFWREHLLLSVKPKCHSNQINGSHCFPEQETLHSLLSTCRSQERIRERYNNLTY